MILYVFVSAVQLKKSQWLTILSLYLRLRSLRKVSLIIDMHLCLYYLWSDDQWSDGLVTCSWD